jgi:hypothetical protein
MNILNIYIKNDTFYINIDFIRFFLLSSPMVRILPLRWIILNVLILIIKNTEINILSCNKIKYE